MESTRDPRLPEVAPSSGAGDRGREGGGGGRGGGEGGGRGEGKDQHVCVARDFSWSV